MSRKDFDTIVKSPISSPYTCFFCLTYPCGKCFLPVFPNNNALCCDVKTCNKWYHLRCTKFSLIRYKKLTVSKTSDSWFCDPCLNFPFASLSNTDMTSLYSALPYIDVNLYQNTCGVCSRAILAKKKAKCLPCKNCNKLIHRKCSTLPISILNSLTKTSFDNFECVKCLSEKFPFTGMSQCQIVEMSYNSNFNCPCSQQCPSPPQYSSNKYRLNINKFVDRHNEKPFNGPDPYSYLEKGLESNIDFDYYDDHKFHKFMNRNHKKTNFFFNISH